MNKRIVALCGVMVVAVFLHHAYGGEVVSSARFSALAIDTVSVTNSTLMLDRSLFPFRFDYSPSIWNDINGVGGSVRITANGEPVLEATQDGTFMWNPPIAGLYSIKHIAANGATISKRVNVVAPTVTIEREGYNLCKLTASDGVSEIRYTTDGTAPTADSPLYTGPFEVPPSRLSFVRASTFAVGCPQGEISFAHFKPVGSFVSAVQANCVIDNSGETIMAGYDAIPLPYDTAWEGDSSSSMELRVDGDLIATRTGAGEVAWTPQQDGMTTLTLRTVNGAGGMLAEYSAQYDVVPRTVIISNGDVAPLRERYPGLCHWITNITIEAGVTDIGASAFAECSGLTSITIPDSVTSIGIGAFDGCDRITSVVLPDLTNIDAYMPGLIQAKFNANNDYTSSIADSDTATSVSGVLMGYAFDTSSASRTFTDPVYGGSYKWNGSNTTFGYLGYMHMIAGRTYVFAKYFDDTVYVKVDGVEVLKNTDHTVFATGTYIPENTGWHELEVRVADGTGEKGPKGAANGYSSYWSAEMGIGWRDDGIISALPESEWHTLMDPGDGSLFRAEGSGTSTSVANLFPDAYAIITNIAWTGEVVNIPAHAFEGCAALRTMEIPTSVTNIGASAFAGCEALTEISIPSGVTSIGDGAFRDCGGLTSITMPDSVTSIGIGAFDGCDRITSVVLPDLTNIDAYVPGLIQAKFNANNDYTSSIADSDTADSVSGVLMGYAFDTSSASRTFTDPVYGGSYKWNGSNTTFGYLGYMHMVAGRTYVFGKYFDDTVYVKVDGVEVLKNTDHTAFATGTYIPENTGWHELEVRVADGTGEKGPKGAANGYSSYWSAEMGIGWRDDGIISALPESEWHELMDPGDGSLFRAEGSGTSTSVANLFPDAYAIITNIAWTGEVVNIPAHAFEGCAALRTMEIPTSVTNIGASAFAGCEALTEISIPSGVTSIGDVAFSGCAGFASVTIPDSVIRIGDGAFFDCSSLTSVRMPYRFRTQFGDTLNGRPITYIATVQIVVDGDELTTIYIPCGSAIGALPSVQPCEGYSAAFYNADVGGMEISADTVVNEDMTVYVRRIANECQVTFDAAGGVVEGEDGHAGRVTLPVTYDSEYGELPTASCDGYVFLGWTLDGMEVTAETVVKTASDHVLTAKWGIQIGNGVWEATVCDEPITLSAPLVPPTGEIVIPAMIVGRTVVGITAEAFAGNTAVTGVAMPASATDIAVGAMGDLQIVVVVDDDGQYISDAIAANVHKVVFAEGVTRIADNWFGDGGHAGRVTLPNLETFDIADSVVRIGTNVFEAACALEPSVQNGLKIYQGWCLGFAEAGGDHAGRMTLPDGLRGIAAEAFKGEYGIATVAFPSTLRFVGAGAFKDCTGLEDIDLPEGVVAVDREAFRNCTYAQSLILPTTLEEIGAGAFANATSLAGVTVPEGVVDIGDVAFSNCWRMMSATIPASVTNVGAAAFSDCRRLTGVTVPLGLGTMAELFPAAYDKITSVRVAERRDGVIAPYRMDAGMFAGCAAMADLTLPEDLAEVSDEAFVGCASMAAFDLPESVTNIGVRAFMGLSQLTAFEFPAGLVAIGGSAFSGCSGITALTLPDGLESIDASAFQGLTQLSRVDIPASVTEIGYGAFDSCERVRAVSLPGDVATVADILPDAYRLITSAAVTARSEIAPYQIVDSLFEGCEALAVVELPASVTGIGARAFAGCTSLTDAGIPSGVTSLGEEVFSGCVNLSSVSLPKGLSVLSGRMFEGCASLNEVIVPEGVATLGANVFNGCSSLRTVAYVGNAPAYNAAAYAGVPASLVTKVVNGSTGWDGIATSKALPEFWPAGTSNEITFWEPNRFMVDFVAAGEGVVATQKVEQVTGTTYMLPADAVRCGAVFGGWWTAVDGGARVTASTQVVLTRPHTFYAHWTFNRYSIHFDANGGEGEMAPQGMTVNTADSLTECGFSRAGYAFVGWATEPDGEVVYADAAEVLDLAYVQNAAVTLYAVWEERDWTLADYVDAEHLTLVNDETAAWTPDWTVFKVGGVSLKSGAIAAAEEGERTQTTLTATVTGEGSGSFWWKVSCEEMDEEYDEWYDYAVFTIDGVEIAKIAGDSGWQQVEYAVTGMGTHVLAWTFIRDDYDEDETAYENAAWVDGVVWTPKPVTVTFAAGGAAEGEAPEAVVKYAGYELTLPGAGTLANGAYQFMGWMDGETTYAAGSTFVFPTANVTLTAVWELKAWTLGEAVDAAALSFTTGGDADWAVDAANGYTNGVSAKSGAIGDGQESWVEATVGGAGTLVFRWNVMGGIHRNNPFAYAKVEVDGVQQAQEHKTEGWKEQTVEVAGAGAHTIRWTYLRTSAREADGDCAWIDAVTWTPSEAAAGVSVEVNGATVEFETALDGKTRTATVAVGTTAEDVKIVVGGVDVTAGFKVAVEGKTASVVLKEPFERTDDAAVSSKPPYRENDDGKTVTLNVEVVPGLYYAADSAATIEALKRPGAAEPAKAGDAVVAPKQEGAQGFYKVWVSDAPIEAE